MGWFASSRDSTPERIATSQALRIYCANSFHVEFHFGPAMDTVFPNGSYVLRLCGVPVGCPLWVISGHMQCKRACPLLPRKRTCAVHLPMSANDPKRT